MQPYLHWLSLKHIWWQSHHSEGTTLTPASGWLQIQHLCWGPLWRSSSSYSHWPGSACFLTGHFNLHWLLGIFVLISNIPFIKWNREIQNWEKADMSLPVRAWWQCVWAGVHLCHVLHLDKIMVMQPMRHGNYDLFFWMDTPCPVSHIHIHFLCVALHPLFFTLKPSK